MRLIDADALKEHYNVPDAEGVFSYCDTIMQVIDSQPTIDAEPVRHGRWVYDETIGGMKHYHCTNCKEHNPGNECIADENQILWFEYCPKCGARMDGGADKG